MEQADGMKLVYDNFQMYTGDVLTNSKTTTLQCTENCKSLDYILWTYFDNTSTGLQPLQLGDAAPATTEAEHFDGSLPSSRYHFDNLLKNRDVSLLNNSVWFCRNGVADDCVLSSPSTASLSLSP